MTLQTVCSLVYAEVDRTETGAFQGNFIGNSLRTRFEERLRMS